MTRTITSSPAGDTQESSALVPPMTSRSQQLGDATVGMMFISNIPFGKGTISTPLTVVTLGSVISFIASTSSALTKFSGRATRDFPPSPPLPTERTVPARESVRRPEARDSLASSRDSFESSIFCSVSISASASSFSYGKIGVSATYTPIWYLPATVP